MRLVSASHMRIHILLGAALPLAACTAGSSGESVESLSQSSIGNNTPGFISHAQDLGPVDPSTVIEVTAWLKLHNENQLDQLVKQQQTKGHANFHKWLTQDQFNAQFSPTSQEVNAVGNWLHAHNLT